MNDKEFVLVSQGIEIYRTKSQENAVNMVKEYNDEYFDYLQKCYDNYERPADNYVDLEIEYSNEKKKDKEIERLNGALQTHEILLKSNVLEIERLNNIINKGIEAINVYQNEKTLSVGYDDLKRIRGILQGNVFDLQMFEEYLQELKGSGSN